MFDVDLVQALLASCHAPPPPSAQAVQGEEASIISEVVEETGQGLEQDGDCGAMPSVKIGEKRLIQGCGG